MLQEDPLLRLTKRYANLENFEIHTTDQYCAIAVDKRPPLLRSVPGPALYWEASDLPATRDPKINRWIPCELSCLKPPAVSSILTTIFPPSSHFSQPGPATA